MALSDLPPYPSHPAYPFRRNRSIQQEEQSSTKRFPKLSRIGHSSSSNDLSNEDFSDKSFSDDNYSNFSDSNSSDNNFSSESSPNNDFSYKNDGNSNFAYPTDSLNSSRSSSFDSSKEFNDPLDPFEQPQSQHSVSSVFPGSGDLPSFVITSDTPSSSAVPHSRKMLYWGIGIVVGVLFISGIIWASAAGINYLRVNSAKNSYSAALKAYTAAQDTWLSERKKAQDLLESTKDQVSPNTSYFAVEKIIDWKLPDIPKEGNSLQSVNAATDSVNASLVVVTAKTDELVKELVELRIAHNRWIKSDSAKPTPPPSTSQNTAAKPSVSPLPNLRPSRRARPDYRPRREDVPRPQATPTPAPGDHTSRSPQSSSRPPVSSATSPKPPAKPENSTKPSEPTQKLPPKETQKKDAKDKSSR